MPLSRPLLFTLLMACALIGNQPRAGEVRIAVAANFTDANREIVSLFEKASGHATKVSYGSTGKLYSQIEHGAPFEVFLAADIERPMKAEAEGLAVADSLFVYARGRLVLWSAKPDRFSDGEAFLKQGRFNHLALANPKTAPYGMAALQVLRHMDALERLKSKLVRGDSIAQTFQFAATGNAEAGFVALAQIKSWHGEAGTLWEIPEDHYAPIAQAAVLLKRGATNPAAREFLAFLQSDAAQEVIERYGYGVD